MALALVKSDQIPPARKANDKASRFSAPGCTCAATVRVRGVSLLSAHLGVRRLGSCWGKTRMSKSIIAVAFQLFQLIDATCCVALLVVFNSERAFCREMTFDEIRNVLRTIHRRLATRSSGKRRSEISTSTSRRCRLGTEAFYQHMTGTLAYELGLPVPTGESRIWQMYNHGFIVKTPSSVFAFDLTELYFPSSHYPMRFCNISRFFSPATFTMIIGSRCAEPVESFGGTLVTTGTFRWDKSCDRRAGCCGL